VATTAAIGGAAAATSTLAENVSPAELAPFDALLLADDLKRGFQCGIVRMGS
jgi:hypothetical protein